MNQPDPTREALREALDLHWKVTLHHNCNGTCADAVLAALPTTPAPSLTTLEMEEFDELTEGWNAVFRARVRAALEGAPHEPA